jgi:hypothetical protein
MVAWYPDPYRFDVKNTVRGKSLDFAYLLRGLQRPVLWSSAICTTFTGVQCVMEQLRDEGKESVWVNSAVAGAVAGALMSTMVTRSFSVMATHAIGVGMLMGMTGFNGQSASTFVPKFNGAMVKGVLDTSKDTETNTLKELKEKYPEFKHL